MMTTRDEAIMDVEYITKRLTDYRDAVLEGLGCVDFKRSSPPETPGEVLRDIPVEGGVYTRESTTETDVPSEQDNLSHTLTQIEPFMTDTPAGASFATTKNYRSGIDTATSLTLYWRSPPTRREVMLAEQAIEATNNTETIDPARKRKVPTVIRTHIFGHHVSAETVTTPTPGSSPWLPVEEYSRGTTRGGIPGTGGDILGARCVTAMASETVGHDEAGYHILPISFEETDSGYVVSVGHNGPVVVEVSGDSGVIHFTTASDPYGQETDPTVTMTAWGGLEIDAPDGSIVYHPVAVPEAPDPESLLGLRGFDPVRTMDGGETYTVEIDSMPRGV
jgi:hypothetical protein